MNKAQQEQHPLVGQIEALTRQMKAQAYDSLNVANDVQREADRYQQMANIIHDVGQRQTEAAARLSELAGNEPFQLPAMFQDAYGHHARQ